MPTLEKTDGGLPRSALRYRPTTPDAITVDEYITAANIPMLPVRRASRVRQPQADDDAVEQDTLDAAQTGRGSATAPRGRRAPTMPTTLPHTPRPKQATRPRARIHPFFFLGVARIYSRLERRSANQTRFEMCYSLHRFSLLHQSTQVLRCLQVFIYLIFWRTI